MALELPLTLADLKASTRALVEHTRPAPSDSRELTDAINFGYGKALRAIRAVRNEHNVSFVDPFSLSSGVSDYDLSAITPVVGRVVRMLVTGGTRPISFKYRALASLEFQAAELSRGGSFEEILYTILEGLMPGPSATTVAGAAVAGASTTIPLVAVGDELRFPLGCRVKIPGAGPNQVVGALGVVSDYYGVVVGVAPASLQVVPNCVVMPGAGVVVTPYQTRVMRVAPPPNAGVSGRLYYQIAMRKLRDDADVIDALVSEFGEDMVVYYAASRLLQGVNDAQGGRFFDQAQEMRSELMQGVDPGSGQSPEAMDSDLWGVD